MSVEEFQIVILSRAAVLKSLTGKTVAPEPDRANRKKRFTESEGQKDAELVAPPQLDAFLRSPTPAKLCPRSAALSLHGCVLSPEYIFQSILRQTLINPDDTKSMIGCESRLLFDGNEDEPLILVDTRTNATTSRGGAHLQKSSYSKRRVCCS